MSHPISSPAESRRLAQVDQLRRRKQRYFTVLAIVCPLLSVVVATWLGTLADVWLGLSETGRWLVFVAAATLAIALSLGVGALPALRWTRKRAIQDIETEHVHLGQLVRTADQLIRSQPANGTTSAELGECIKAMAERELNVLDIDRLVSWKPVCTVSLGLAVCLLLLMLSSVWRDFRVGLARVAWPPSDLTYTTVVLQSTEQYGVNEAIEIHAQILGRPVAAAVLHFRGADSQWLTARMKQMQAGDWRAVLEDKQEDIHVFVTAGDGRSTTRLARFVFKPKIETIAVRLEYPDYTALEPVSLDEGSFRAVEGTHASVTVRLNQVVEQAQFVVGGKPVETHVDGRTVSFEHQVARGDTEYHLWAANRQKLELPQTTFTVVGEEDQLPKVEIVQPPGDLQVTRVTELPIRVRVRDDYGVKELGLVVEKNSQRREQLLRRVNADEFVLADEQQTKLMLERLDLTVNENLRIYAFARDRNPLHNKMGVSELAAVDILPFQRPFIKIGGS